MTKKKRKKGKGRVLVPFDTGTRVHPPKKGRGSRPVRGPVKDPE